MLDKPPAERTALPEQAASSPHPADHKLLSRTVADWLAERIITGAEPPGARLTEPKLAELAGVSRSPVREALRILAGEGLVELVPRLGAQVARIGPEDARELYACRTLLEPRAAGLAAAAVTDDGLRALDELRAAMERAVADRDARRFLDENVAYFRALLGHCPNATLRELVDLTWKKAIRYWSIFGRIADYGVGSLARHRALHDAVRARDAAGAESANRAILEHALREILATFEQTEPGKGRAA